MVEADQVVLAGQLHRRHGQRELPARKTPVVLLDRTDPRVQCRSDAQRPVQLGHQQRPPFSVSDASGSPNWALIRVQRLPGVRKRYGDAISFSLDRCTFWFEMVKV